MAIALNNLEYELVNPPNEAGVHFGRNTTYHVELVTFGDVSSRVNDESNPRADGTRMGRDFYNNRTITFDINIISKTGQCHAMVSALQACWNTADVVGSPSRMYAGRLSTLRMFRHGVHKVVYGRPRRFTPVTGRVDLGWVPVTCDFVTIDHLFYEEHENVNLITISPPDIGGFIFPVEFPWGTVPISSQADIVQVLGDAESWLRFKITGPIVNPVVDFVGYWQVKTNLTLLNGETLTIDPRPWNRGVYKNNTGNAAGVFTADSRRLSGLTAPPGVHQIVLRGVDGTGTAQLETRWQNTYNTW